MEGLTCVLLTNQFWSIASEERRVCMISFMINSVKGIFFFGGEGGTRRKFDGWTSMFPYR